MRRYTLLRKALAAKGVEVTAFAAALNVTRQHLRKVAIGERESRRIMQAIRDTINDHKRPS